jgi:hypothetical protein
MDIELKKEIKPLIANILRINFERYINTKNFQHTLLEYNFDLLWRQANKQINTINPFIGITGNQEIGYMDAFQLILNDLYSLERSEFFVFIKVVLIDFIRWDNSNTDLAKIISCLKELKLPEDDLHEINDLILSMLLDELIPEGKTERVESIEVSQVLSEIDPNLCFVIMPFDDKLDPIYETAIKPVIQNLKLKCLRADEIFASKPIVEDILNCIKSSNIIIADLTGRNANVFYELGLAHALNKNVILLTQDISDVPFDLKHLRIIEYQNSIPGGEKFKKVLKKYIEEYLSRKYE